VRERRDYMLLSRFDDTSLPGLLPDVVTIDLRRYTPAEFADLVASKLATLGIGPSSPAGTAATISSNRGSRGRTTSSVVEAE